jgi:hypothetical protein
MLRSRFREEPPATELQDNAVLPHLYVRLKRGGQHTGRDLHNGSPPVAGTELNVPLVTGRSVKARIGSYHEGSKRIGNPVSVVINVYADEI